MVRPWVLSETTKVCERTETATKKRRISRQNAVETALPAQNTPDKQQNFELRSLKRAKSQRKQNQHNSEDEQTQRRRNAQQLEENARCRPKLGNSNNENRTKKGVRAAGQPVGKNKSHYYNNSYFKVSARSLYGRTGSFAGSVELGALKGAQRWGVRVGTQSCGV